MVVFEAHYRAGRTGINGSVGACVIARAGTLRVYDTGFVHRGPD